MEDRSASSSESVPSPSLSTTSPSSVSTPGTSPKTLNGRDRHLAETNWFLSDIRNYIALGCLTFEDLTNLDDEESDRSWQDCTRQPLLLAFDQPLSHSLNALINAGWIRICSRRSTIDSRFFVFRVYNLPFDIGHRFVVDRESKRLSAALENLLKEIDVSAKTWEGAYTTGVSVKFDPWATKDDGSLFWMFNNLPSASPDPQLVKGKYAREALEDLLDSDSLLLGLKTTLYPYQRRSAGLMLQRESISTFELDPRLERRVAPDGSIFYYGARDLKILRDPRYYEACKGGILAETMGYGKTLICLATILATKDHLPMVPADYNLRPTRPTIAKLSSMAISAINRNSVPWKVELAREMLATGNEMESCRQKLASDPPCYEIPVLPMRWNRATVLPPPKKMTLAATTIIVVPRNLCRQWQSEIQKHVEVDSLRLLVMDDPKRSLPDAEEIRTYDIVLFTRRRFEMEIRDGADEQGRRLGSTQLLCRCTYIGATRTRDCHCIRADELYDSPLKSLHFKRIIVDEGSFFSNTNATAVSVANKLVTADHRWVVSGTPARDLLGVEVDMSAADGLWLTPDTKDSRDAVLEQRRHFSTKDDTNGAIKSLGALASSFLGIQPWSPDPAGQKADWDEYVFRHEDFRKRSFSSFSSSLRRTLEAMVIKTQPGDVERDIELPPLSHEVVHLEPSFFDKITANLFALVLTANAITSEREDQDYLFHKNSLKSRTQLISNLRQSAFFWTGFSESDVLASLKSSRAYLEKENAKCSDADRRLLVDALECAEAILQSEGWKCMSRSHELGLYVDNWPSESADHWTFESTSPVLTGVSQLLEAQSFVNNRAAEDNPGEGLAGAGIKALAPARYGIVMKENSGHPEKPVLTKSGIPTSSIEGEPMLKRRASFNATAVRVSPKKTQKQLNIRVPRRKHPGDRLKDSASLQWAAGTPEHSDTPKRAEVKARLPNDSPFLKSRIVGTASAKLSYLISQVIKYQAEEKILIFYSGENAAYYLAQMLELCLVQHEIYAKSLSASLKAEYVVRFERDQELRVLLMDIGNAAFGLNLPSASRIYFVNPVCRPNVEAQAIKRAHRIGQTRKVFVETLVLKGSIEEKMLERSNRMTRSEHKEAKSIEDDGGVRKIIQQAGMVAISENERHGYGQMAPLVVPQQLWGQPGWEDFPRTNGPSSAKKRKRANIVPESADITVVDDDVRPSKVIRRQLSFVDVRENAESSLVGNDDSDDEPILRRWRRESTTEQPAQPMESSALSLRSNDPFWPQMNTGAEGLPLQNQPDQEFRSLPIANLLNGEPAQRAEAQAHSDNPGPVERVFKWL